MTFDWLIGKTVKTKLTIVNIVIAVINVAVIGYAFSTLRSSVGQIEDLTENEHRILADVSRLRRLSGTVMEAATRAYLDHDAIRLGPGGGEIGTALAQIDRVIKGVGGYAIDRNALSGLHRLNKDLRKTLADLSVQATRMKGAEERIDSAWEAFVARAAPLVSTVSGGVGVLTPLRALVRHPPSAGAGGGDVGALAENCVRILGWASGKTGGAVAGPCDELAGAARSGGDYLVASNAARVLLVQVGTQFAKMNGLLDRFLDETGRRLAEKREESGGRLKVLTLVLFAAIAVSGSVIVGGHVMTRKLVVARIEAMRRGMAAWLADRTPLPPTKGEDELAEMALFTKMFVETIERREEALTRTAERLRRSEAELVAARDHAEKALATERQLREEQRNFVSMLSHEFRTPLAIIDRAAQMVSLKTSDVSEQTRKRLIRIRQSTSKLSGLVDTFLAAKSFDAGNLTVTWAEIPAQHLFDLVREDLPDWSGRDRLTFSMKPKGAVLVGDEKLLGIALSNLVGNALAYSPPKSPVRVSLRVAGNEAVLSVVNQGAGMTGDELSQAGTMYFRGKSSSGTSGTGLGLYISRRIAENHGGRLQIASVPEQETEVSLHIPLRLLAADPLPGAGPGRG